MSTRSRSASPRPSKRRRTSRSPTPSDAADLPHDAKEITADDYFAKNDEFRAWLRDEKHKYFDELSGEKARSYFRKFVRAWNRGKLPRSLYAGINPTSTASAAQTSFKWGFAQNSNRAEREALERARGEVGSLTWGGSSGDRETRVQGPERPRVAGPSMPSASDLRLAQESAAEAVERERLQARKAGKKEAKERLEEVAPREVGRERMLEKKRERREGDRQFRDGKGDDAAGLEVDEKSLLGGDSFQERIRQRDAARARFEDKKRTAQREKEAEMYERTSARRAKESETMDMFKRMAKERFG
ncbi:hypothetical protein CALVIDRAFT_539378 [Calocera viscosa TUFC12733]|uniref:Splicing arginine serine-rich 12 n=1 Tax=Calocera viscosa (strain TUFC12733) TaxID=1330018 RepID=A0A167JWH4_CALVF|nr:hypothetical protein CALVIDRAFT_539378 [Calocera viscosa TUFC12733]